MPRPFQPGVVSANDLLSGKVIYLAADGRWVDRLAQAELITSQEQADERLGLAERQPEVAVGPYIAPAAAGEAGPTPAHFREDFRATGPSAPARKSWGATARTQSQTESQHA